jgi:polyferredoxin
MIKIAHTAVWVFMVVCISALPVFGCQRRFGAAAAVFGIVLIETIVLIANGWTCPLTSLAARYTAERDDNFDIYLPLWLARHNKLIFGSLFAGATLFTFLRWIGK